MSARPARSCAPPRHTRVWMLRIGVGIVSALLPTSLAHAGMCMGHPDLLVLAEETEVVFVGTALDVTSPRRRDGLIPEYSARRFAVTIPLRGVDSDTVTVRNPTSSAAYHFEEGRSYLVAGDRIIGGVDTSLCRGNRPGPPEGNPAPLVALCQLRDALGPTIWPMSNVPGIVMRGALLDLLSAGTDRAIRDSAFETLVDRVDDRGWLRREVIPRCTDTGDVSLVLEAWRRLGDPGDAVPAALTALLHAPDHHDARRALQALGSGPSIHLTEAEQSVLLARLDVLDLSRFDRNRVLGRIGNAAPPILARLRDDLSGSEPRLRHAPLRALARILGPESDELTRLWRADPDHHAAPILGGLVAAWASHPATRRRVEAVLADPGAPPNARAAAIAVMDEVGIPEPHARARIGIGITDPDPRIRRAALDAWVDRGVDDSVLVESLRDPDHDVVNVARLALAARPRLSEATIAHLLEMLDDESSGETAAWILISAAPLTDLLLEHGDRLFQALDGWIVRAVERLDCTEGRRFLPALERWATDARGRPDDRRHDGLRLRTLPARIEAVRTELLACDDGSPTDGASRPTQ